MRVLSLIILLIISTGLAFAPTGVPLRIFSDADASKIPSTLLLAAKFERLSYYAATLAVMEYDESRGASMSQPETLLTYGRGHIFSGKKQMIAFALERAYVKQNIQGWEAAANQCFNKVGEELTLADAAVLLIHIRSPTRSWGKEVSELLERRNALLRKIAEHGSITKNDVAAATQSPLIFCRET